MKQKHRNKKKLAKLTLPWLTPLRILSVIGLGLSVYLAIGSWSGGSLPGCGMDSGCGAVLQTRWARILGIPVGFGAILLYGFLLAGSFALPKATAEKQINIFELMLMSGVLLIGGAIWFGSLQLFVVKAICPFCMAAHVCGMITGGLLLGKLTGSGARIARNVGLGIAIVAAGAAAQIIYHPKTYQVQGVANSAPTASATTTSSRILELDGGRFSLKVDELPKIGPSTASNVIVHLFDYSCHHCRDLHPVLLEACRNLSNQLAIILLPMPLDGRCNYLITSKIPDHTNACDYARAALAVWRADSNKFDQFEHWIFAPTRPPPPEEVYAEAMRMVGTNEFLAAANDAWVKQQIDLSVRIYHTNFFRFRQSRLPQLLIGTNLVTGILNTPAELYPLLSSQFKIQIPN